MLNSDLCHNIRKAARAVTLIYERLFENPHLRYTQFLLLVIIKETPENNLSILASTMGMERTTVTRNITSMLDQGFIVRKSDKNIKLNEKRYVLTELGKQVFEELRPLFQKISNQYINVNALLNVAMIKGN